MHSPKNENFSPKWELKLYELNRQNNKALEMWKIEVGHPVIIELSAKV